MNQKYKKIKGIKVKGIKGMILAIILVLAMSIIQVTAQDEISPPFEPSLASKVRDILDEIGREHPKLHMEITRRMEFYFYIADKIDALMDIYNENLIPFIYQKDLFQGNAIKNTPPLLRAPMVLGILNLFIRILQPFYLLAILITSVYLLFVSGSPLGRARAKSTLIKLIIGLGIITLTLPIIEMLLETSHYFTSMLLSIPSIEEISSPIDPEMFMVVKEFFIKYFLRITLFETFVGIPFLTLLILLPVSVLMVLAIRYFMVILLTTFFPFTVLLYSFFATKRIGETLLNQTFLWIFIPVIDAVILLVTWIAYKSIFSIPELTPGTLLDISTFIVFSGFLVLIFAPFIALGVMNWISSLGLVSVILLKPAKTTMAYFERSVTEEESPTEYKNIKEEVGE